MRDGKEKKKKDGRDEKAKSAKGYDGSSQPKSKKIQKKGWGEGSTEIVRFWSFGGAYIWDFPPFLLFPLFFFFSFTLEGVQTTKDYWHVSQEEKEKE